jgi:response regulator of citrate/malate metabolism
MRAPTAGLDPVTRLLVVAARERHELRSVVECATATGLCSRGTASRVKRRLEDAGIVDTEPVSSGVGRPRQRLLLADDSLKSMEVAELIQIVDGMYL